MAKAPFKSGISRSTTVLLALLAALLLASCAGGSGNASGITEYEQQLALLSGSGRTSPPPVALSEALPPVPLDIGSRDRAASAVQSIKILGSQTFSRSSAAVDEGNNVSMSAGERQLEWVMYEFAPPTDQVFSALFSVVGITGNSNWIAIANYGTMHWDFKGPYPSTPGFVAFANLSSGDYVSPGGHLYALALSWNSSTLKLSDVTISVEDGQAPTYDLGGQILNDAAQPLEGVTVTIIPGGGTDITDATGSFLFPGLSPASYKLTPSAPGYDFTPTLQTVLVTNADVTNVQFVASPEVVGFDISGVVSIDSGGFLEGATLTLTPGGQQVQSDVAGNYAFFGLNAGNYTVTPSHPDYSFTPSQQSVPLFGSDATGIDFSASEDTGPPFTVSGTVTDNNGLPLQGANVFVPFTDRITTTDAQGNYSIGNLQPDTNFHILPSLNEYSFVPNIQKFNLDGNKVVNFVGTHRDLPATVTYAQHMVPWVLQPMCTPCHNSTLNSEDERHGAPLGIDFDTYNGTDSDEKKDAEDEIDFGSMPDEDGWGSLAATTFQKDLFQRWRDQNFPQ